MGENAQVQILGELKSVSLSKLPNLEHLWKQIPKGIHAFQNLGELNVDGCGNMGYLISSSVALMLVNLKSLSVAGCESMTKVIEMNEECGVKKIVFRSLSKVILKDLENLLSFCSSNQAFEFPSLEEMFIVNCPDMKIFCYGHLTTEKLHGVKVSPLHDNDDEPVWKDGLNETVRYLHERISRNPTTNIRDKVMEALKDDKIRIIGICGISGIGKTKILQEVCERARNEKLFDEVAMTTVSQAAFHLKRLTKGRKILVVLDDIRSKIELKEVGIPSKNGCSSYKVVLISRDESVCTDSGSKKNISVGVLSKEEAWHLFKKTAGNYVETDNLKKIAKEVADECGGVPIALITLARALFNKERGVWEDARTQLRQSNITIPKQMNKHVYRSIKLSYDILANEQPGAQPLLLICCKHPLDAKIEVEKLARYCLALELFGNVDIVDARIKTYEVINHLKSCFLLQAVDVDEEKKDQNDETVKMHDVVRDVCLFVSPVEDSMYMQIMADGTSKVDYPKKTEQMKELKIFENLGGAEEHVPKFQCAENLRMLSLERISLSKEIMSTIGKLRSLEILSFWQSTISLLPCEIGQLSNLKLLDLRCAVEKGPFRSNILRKLNKLEVLYMGNFFLLGGADNDKRVSDGLITELDYLSNLTALQIVLVDPNDLLSLKRFDFKKLKSFFLASLEDTDFISERNRLCPSVHKTIEFGNFSGMEGWFSGGNNNNIQLIARSTVDLTLEDIEDWTDPLIVLKGFTSLKKLDLRRCNQLEYIHGESLGELELLKLTDMSKLRRLWVGPSDPMCLGSLREVVITNCPALEMRKEPPSDFRFQTSKLRGIYHRNTLNLQLDDGQPQQPLFNPTVMLSSLKRLNCFEMHGLKQIVGGGMLKFPKKFPKLAASDWLQHLEVVEVSGCGSLEKVFDFEGLKDMLENANGPRLGELKCVRLSKLSNLEHLFWHIPEGIHAFQNLGELNVESCCNLGYLISSSVALMLVNLKSLSVAGCESMSNVIEMNKEKKIVFCSLSKIILKDLEKLSSFCSSNVQASESSNVQASESSNVQVFEFPSLEEMFIVNCPGMKIFCYGHLTTEKLHGVKVSPLHDNDDELVWKDDLNETVRNLNERKRVDPKKDGVSKEGSADENAKCINETESIGDDEVGVLKIKGKEKVAKSEEDDGNDKILWTEAVLYKFLEVHKGNRRTTTFSREGWNSIVNALKDYNITKTQCTAKFNELRNGYTCVKNLCKETGIVVNPETGMIEDQEWEKLKKVKEGCDLFRKLQTIFEDTTSTKMHSDNEGLQNKRRNSFDPNLGLLMQHIGLLMQQMSENAQKCSEILEKQFGQASQGSETIRDSGGDTYVKPE